MVMEWKSVFGTCSHGGHEGTLIALAVFVISCLLHIIISRRRRAAASTHDDRFPRGPPAWPIIGHLPLLKTAPHQVLADLFINQGYGPIIGLRLGSQPAVVVSSVALAKELLLTHDKTFANRPHYQFADLVFYGYDTSVILSSYSPHWARFRKIYTLELFTAKRLQHLQHIRQDEVRGLLRRLLEGSLGGTRAVDVGRLLFDMTSNSTARLLQSKTFADVAPELPELIEGMAHESLPVIGDFISWLKWLDGPKKRRMKNLHDRIDRIFDSILIERRQLMARSTSHDIPQDFLQVLLSRETTAGSEEELLSAQEIKGIMLDIVSAGIHTSAVTLEWAIAELIRNPTCLRKLRDEIDGAMEGKGKDVLVRDEDIPKLPYLENTVKETFRLHPVIPMLVPRMSSEVCKVGKYTLPRKTHAFVNVWAICRDPVVWENPEAFCPERFEGRDMDVRGLHYELLPFGAGRRVCPGMRLGLSVVQVTLANLVKAFDWELPLGHTPLSMDMSEKGGLASSKAISLLAIPKPRKMSSFQKKVARFEDLS